jgi:RHS repeat-associated protein
VRQVTQSNTNTTMTFGYDAQQHRLKKSVTINGVTKTTYYIRDAQGNPLAVYERTNGTTLTWKEQDLYGSSRLGMQKPEKVVTGYLWYDCPNGWYGSWTKSGAKSYELSNHLGNVMAVISDRGELQSAQDYFPFGMAMPGRSTTSTYKYGFNGQEKDTEIGEGIYTAEFWEYDARLGRRFNLDPVDFAWQSPYATFNNNPIALSDPSGATAEDPVKKEKPKNELDEVVITGKNESSKSQPLIVKSIESMKEALPNIQVTQPDPIKPKSGTSNSKQPSFATLWSNYPPNKGIKHVDPATKADAFDNHCAINVSHTLIKSGIKMTNFKGRRCFNSCPLESEKLEKHALNAEELAGWLHKRFGAPTKYTGATFEAAIEGKTGIVFFQDYWHRKTDAEGVRTGDHIDLWNENALASKGWFLTAVRRKYPTFSEYLLDMSDLRKSKYVLFWEMK